MLQAIAYPRHVPKLPGLGDVMGLLKAQTEALIELPATVASLQRAVRALADTVAVGAETLLVVQNLAIRIDRLVEEIEGPVLALAPGLQRAAKVLDDPVVDSIPDTVRRVQHELLPLLRTLTDTQQRLAAFPGASLLGQLAGRPRPPAEPRPADPAATPTKPPERKPPDPRRNG